MKNTLGHFRDESFPAIDCTGTDNQTTTRKYTKHKMHVTNPNTNKLVLVKHQNTKPKPVIFSLRASMLINLNMNLNLKQFSCQNCSCQCAYDNTAPNSSENLPSYPPHKHHCSNVV